MSIAGDYKFHSMMSFDDEEGAKYLTIEELLQKPVPEGTDPEEAEDNRKELLSMTNMLLRICEDGTLKVMSPIPEEVSQEELDAAIASGEVFVEDGYIYDKVQKWEDRDGVIYYDTGIEGEIFGEKADPWDKLFDDEGLADMMFMKFKKV